MLKEGMPAPDFEAPTDDGGTFRLSDYKGKQPVVLYFYPKDFTMGCTREACNFRDNYEELQKRNAVLIGVSADSAESHQSFREEHGLPFPLIPDPDKRIIELYDVGAAFLGFATARVTYVIDTAGVIRATVRHDLFIAKHLTEVLNALGSMASPAAN